MGQAGVDAEVEMHRREKGSRLVESQVSGEVVDMPAMPGLHHAANRVVGRNVAGSAAEADLTVSLGHEPVSGGRHAVERPLAIGVGCLGGDEDPRSFGREPGGDLGCSASGGG